MRALSIRQPFAEMILRGMKTIEYRSRPTRIIGERFYIYASRRPAVGGRQKGAILRQAQNGIWSRDLGVPDEPLPPWMIELAEGLKLWKPGELPVGVIVGSAVIERCAEVGDRGSEVGSGSIGRLTTHEPLPTIYQWHLADVQRLARPRKPVRHPQPAWFTPF